MNDKCIAPDEIEEPVDQLPPPITARCGRHRKWPYYFDGGLILLYMIIAEFAQ